MAITYNAGTNTITVTGYTEATPCNFTDIYNADVAGGWGVVTRQCTNQFCISAILMVGDGSTATWFADTKKQVILTASLGILQGHIRVRANAHFRVGKIVDAAKKTSIDGCYLLSTTTSNHPCIFGVNADWNYGHNIEIYSSILESRNASTAGWQRQVGLYLTNLKIRNSVLNGSLNTIDGITCYNLRTVGDDVLSCQIFQKMKGTTSLDDIEGNNLFYAFTTTSLSTSDMIVKNVLLKNCAAIGYCANNAYDIYLINTVSDAWVFAYSSFTGKVYRQYEFDLKVVDKDNTPIQTAAVKIWDKDSNLIVDTTTDVNGVIATQTISRGYYNQPNGNTLQEASPHLIKIEKAGYTTYEADFTLESKTDWLIALQTSILRNPSMTGGMV